MKYLSKFDEIKLRIPKGQKEELKAAAAAQNKSLNQYILDKLDGQH
jgi:predicted HicB family RNase H-like nuclease